MKPVLTEEQIAARRAALAKGRETAAANRATAKEAAAEIARIVTEPAAPALPVEPIIEPDPPIVGESVKVAVAARRERLLQGIDPDIARLITDAELDLIELQEREKAEAERKKNALATVRETLRTRARIENDLISADAQRTDEEKKRLAEKVTFRIVVPNDGAGHRGRSGIKVDNRLFEQGRVYTETRAVFESLQYMHYRAWLNEVEFRTLDQHKPGQSAKEILGHTIPRFEIAA